MFIPNLGDMIPFDEHIFSNGWERTPPTIEKKMRRMIFAGEISATNSQKNWGVGLPDVYGVGLPQVKKPLEPQDKAMEDQELEPLEKAIQTAHSNFFVEEERFVCFFFFPVVDGWICLGKSKSD